MNTPNESTPRLGHVVTHTMEPWTIGAFFIEAIFAGENCLGDARNKEYAEKIIAAHNATVAEPQAALAREAKLREGLAKLEHICNNNPAAHRLIRSAQAITP